MSQPIAIVGLGGVFPGAPDLDTFWSRVLMGVSSASEVPAERWPLPAEAVYDPQIGAADHVYSRRACLVSGFAFDPRGFALEADVLERLDPLFHLALTAARAAWRDARTENVDRARVGVVLGNLVLPSESASKLAEAIVGRTFREAAGLPAGSDATPDLMNRFVAGLPGGVVARALGLGGGAFTLDAACASSLYALKVAIEELRAGRMDAMLAGGVSRPDCLYTQMGFGQLRALSPTGRSAPFDATGDGLVVGEGAGVVMLKRLADAERDGDHIHAVLHGVGLSNDLDGSLLAPSNEGQLRAMRAAYAEAGWDPRDVDLVECHATGTPLGDGVEVASLKALWGADGWTPGQCVIGSVKSNVGHLLTAAGSVGLIKLVHALRDKVLPPTANFKLASAALGLEGSPFKVLSSPTEWPEPAGGRPRRAALSAFGFGGINAHVLIEEPPAHRAQPSAAGSEAEPEVAVAIVGMATRFGGLETLREFQEAVLGGHVAARHRLTDPATRWWGVAESDWYQQAGLGHKDFSGYMLDRLEVPTGAFRIPPRELTEMLPQQLLALLLAKDALKDAGMPANERRPGMGAFIGIGLDPNATNFHVRWMAPESLRDAVGPALSANRTVGALGGMVASRVAREFRLGGPCFTISSEETSGLRALEAATRALQRRELDAALVGAVDLPGDPRAALAANQARPVPHTGGESRPFEVSSGGVRLGEGGAMLVLKRLDDAIAAGDRIYAVVSGLGAATGTAEAAPAGLPSPGAYQTALELALGEAHAGPESLGYVEAHAGGDPREDAYEANELNRALTDGGLAAQPHCAVGSVKSAIGHTGAAAGLAGVVKAALCLYQEILPAARPDGVGYREPQPALAVGGALHAPRRAQFWTRDRVAGPRRAAVAAISVDGGCAAAVLEAFEHIEALPATTREQMARERREPLGRMPVALFTLAAPDAPGLASELARLGSWVAAQPELAAIETLARGWARETTPGALGLAIVANDRADLLARSAQAIAHLARSPQTPLGELGPIAYTPRPLGPTAPVAHVFPGSGSHYAGMGLDLGARFPEVLRNHDLATGTLARQLRPVELAPWRLDWPANWEQAAEAALGGQHEALLLGQVAFGALTRDLVQRFGPAPSAAIGYCLGETAAFVATRTWADRDELTRRMEGSPLFTRDLAGPCEAARATWACRPAEQVDWMMGLVDRDRLEVEAALEGLDRAYLLIVNVPNECVIGGDRAAVLTLVERLGCSLHELHGVTSVHCEVVAAVGDAYRALHLHTVTPPAGLAFYSGAYGKRYEITSESAAGALLAQATSTFDFVRLVEQAYADGIRVFLELGPRRSCARMVKAILGERPHLALSISARDENELRPLLAALGRLHAERLPIDLGALYGEATDAVGVMPQAPPTAPTVKIHWGGGPFERPAATQPERATASSPSDSRPPANGRVQAGGFLEPESPPAHPTATLTHASAVATQPAPRPAQTVPVASAVATSSSARAVQTSTASAPGAHERATSPSMSQDSPYAPALDARPLMAVSAAQAAAADAHGAFLRLAERQMNDQLATLAHRAALLEAIATGQPLPTRQADPAQAAISARIAPAPAAVVPAAPASIPFMDREACLTYARGAVGHVLGEAFAAADAYPTRVRLPDEPLMLVDRIMSVSGEPLSMTHGTVVTEHDVLPGAWYLDAGRIPTCVAVEAGQADLFLSGYLGIDFETRGLQSYRLLDAVVTFHAPLPGPGAVIRYDIAIERFARQGDTWIFFFHFEATVDGQPLISMRKGCAGFFSPAQLADGKGVVHTALDLAPMAGKLSPGWRALTPMALEAYDDARIDRLRAGDLAGAFGPAFAALPLHAPVRLPDGLMRLVHRVLRLEPTGGRFGIGFIEGEADIHPDDWFLTCHFVDDMVMPGTLMYECCMHTLRVFLMRMGWVGEADGVVYEPVPGVASTLKCRGQVLATTRRVTYEITLKEMGYGGLAGGETPYAIADALMLADGKPIVQIKDMSVRASGLTRSGLEALWQHSSGQLAAPAAAAAPGSESAPLYGPETILAYAIGKPSEAFGAPYMPFDSERVIARLPGPPYMFLDRVTEVTGPAWEMRAGAGCVAHYDIPPDAWYFTQEGQPTMPFAVLLEVGLQPCGWLAGYVGSALTSPIDLSFRNLGGEGTQHREVTPQSGTLTTRVALTKVSQSGGMIIQEYALEVSCQGLPVYTATTSFGFFTKAALAQQVGVRGVTGYAPGASELARALPMRLDEPPFPLPGPLLRMVDAVDCYIPDGGPHGLGFVRGTKQVNPAEWFFAAHFYQDPVCPGSLGLESMLQLMKLLAAKRLGQAFGPEARFEVMANGHNHQWIYRGQIVPSNHQVVVEAVIKAVDEANGLVVADGLLCVDGISIYQMTDFALRVVRP